MKLLIIIPAYNAGSYFKTAIRSVREQPDFSDVSEIIVIGNGIIG